MRWVECGYTRGWDPDLEGPQVGQDILTAYWAASGSYGYTEHKVTNTSVSAGQNRIFSIESRGGRDWSCYIDWTPARDASGDYTANEVWGNNSFDSFDMGLESNCTTGLLGTSTNWISIATIKKSSDGGTNWSFGPPLGDVGISNPSGPPYAFGHWGTSPGGGSGAAGQVMWDYRNNNAP